MPSSGTPIAEASFAAASVSEVAKLRSRDGNQTPIAFAFAGNVGASPIPSSSRALKNPGRLGVIAAANDARLQMKMPIRCTRFTPKRSSTTPTGS